MPMNYFIPFSFSWIVALIEATTFGAFVLDMLCVYQSVRSIKMCTHLVRKHWLYVLRSNNTNHCENFKPKIDECIRRHQQCWLLIRLNRFSPGDVCAFPFLFGTFPKTYVCSVALTSQMRSIWVCYFRFHWAFFSKCHHKIEQKSENLFIDLFGLVLFEFY